MKPVWVLIFVMVALTVRPGASPAGDIREERVRFEPGAAAATLKGSITGDRIVDYLFGARAGQTMRVRLEADNDGAYFNVLPPRSEAAIAIGANLGNAWTGTLPVDGDYRVRVFLVRSAARRGETAAYTLTVGITSGPAGERHAGDARHAGTSFHATGEVPCSVGPDPKGSARCSFGVIRGGPGNAEVHLAPVGYDVMLHPDKVETILLFKGDTATSADPKDKVTAEKRGDEWSIGVNDVRFYTIYDAVIVGG
jgi:hypothetical protein